MANAQHAVIIGVNKYQDETINELNGAENDARELHQRLINPTSGGFSVAPNHFLVGKDATADAIRRALSDLLWKTNSSDLSLLYFSGHGFHDVYGDGFIAPYDMLRDQPVVRGIRMQELDDLVQRAKMKKTVLVILDCCYSGIAAGGRDAGPALDKPPVENWFGKGEGRFILTSAGKDEKSHERAGCLHTIAPAGEEPHYHGIFSYHLLEALDGKAATGADDEITLQSLINYINKEMENNPEHKPRFLGSDIGQFGQIRIARASQYRSIKDRLEEVSVFIQRNTPLDNFLAARRLGEILKDFRELEEAKKLAQELDGKLKVYRGPAGVLLMKKKLEVEFSDYRTALDTLRPIAGNLSVQQLTELAGDAALLGLLETVVSVSHGNVSEDNFKFDLIAYANSMAHSANAASAGSAGEPKGTK